MSTKGKVITCKAAVAWEPGKPLTIEDVQVDPPKEHEVRVKMMWSGVCHTDWAYLHEAEWGESSRPYPVVLGHEGAGKVESVGPGVTNVAPGDKVIPLFLPQCGECKRCHSPKTNLCKKNWETTRMGVMADGTSRISYMGQQVYQYLGLCTLSQYTVVADTSVAKIRSDAPLHQVYLLGCGVSMGYGEALNTAQVERGSVCAVFGLGAVGLAAVMGCRAAGASRIIAVDINPEKFNKAMALGATECINPLNYQPRPIQEILKEQTQGGVDYALDCVGYATVTSQALESTNDAWGVCVVCGVVGGRTGPEPLSFQSQLLAGRTLKGSYFGGWKGARDIPALVDKCMKEELKLDVFISYRLKLDEVNTALQELKGDGIRSQIKMWPVDGHK